MSLGSLVMKCEKQVNNFEKNRKDNIKLWAFLVANEKCKASYK
jgi:hypothetical protein